VQRPEVHAGAGQRIHRLGLGQGKPGRHDGVAGEARVQRRDAVEVDAGQPQARQRACGDPPGEMRDRREGDVRVIGGQRRRHLRRPKRVGPVRHREARQARIEAHRHRHVVGQRHRAPLPRLRDLPFQVVQHLLALGLGIGDPRQPFGGGDGGGGDGRVGQGSCSVLGRGGRDGEDAPEVGGQRLQMRAHGRPGLRRVAGLGRADDRALPGVACPRRFGCGPMAPSEMPSTPEPSPFGPQVATALRFCQ